PSLRYAEATALLLTRMGRTGANRLRLAAAALRAMRQMMGGRLEPGRRRSQPGTLPMRKPPSPTSYTVARPAPERTSSRTVASVLSPLSTADGREDGDVCTIGGTLVPELARKSDPSGIGTNSPKFEKAKERAATGQPISTRARAVSSPSRSD